MKKKVGILLRSDETYHLNKELVNWLEEYEIIPIGIVNNYLKDMIEITKLCDGVILQGGNNYSDVELKYVKYLYENNIPTLGICLGMQMMGVAMDGSLSHLKNNKHYGKENYIHSIEILKNTKLYDIVKSDVIDVNSRHNDYVRWTELTISGISEDGIIEAIEDKNHKFFIGVQWHPETLKDLNSNRLLIEFKNSL